MALEHQGLLYQLEVAVNTSSREQSELSRTIQGYEEEVEYLRDAKYALELQLQNHTTTSEAQQRVAEERYDF